MNGRAVLLFALIFGLLLGGLALLNAAVLALAVPLLVYLGAGLVREPAALKLRTDRTFDRARVTPGAPITVTVTAENQSEAPHTLLVEDTLPDGLTRIEGETRTLLSLQPRQRATLQYSVRGERGEYRFNRISTAESDPHDLTAARATHPAAGIAQVLPDTQSLRGLTIRPPRTRGFAGPIPARTGGSGVDFFALREYQAGDRLRAINWRATARAMTRDDRNLYTNVFEQQRIANIGFIIDARLKSDVRTPNGSLFEHTVHAAAAMAERFLGEGNRVAMLIYTDTLVTIYPGYGRVQRERILRALGRAKPAYHAVFESLSYVPTRLFPAQSQIVFIGPVNGDDPATLMRLRALGYSVLVVSPDPVTFELASVPASDRQAEIAVLAERLARAERAQRFRLLRRAGCQIVDWDIHKPLDAALRETVAGQPAQLRMVGGL